MALQPAVCSSCGGRIKVDDVDLSGYGECEFCHVPHKIIEVITIDGLPTVKSLITNAEFAMDDGNAEKAVKLFNEVLTIKPNCHEAWWGLYLCHAYYDRFYQYKDKYGNSGPMTKASMMLTTIEKYAVRAIEYAPEVDATGYRRQIQDELDFIESVRTGGKDKETGGKKGCYIATAVYGSYECDQVFALRRYRDDHLAKHLPGRCFIRIYYAISPKLIRFLDRKSNLTALVRRFLDVLVEKLKM